MRKTQTEGVSLYERGFKNMEVSVYQVNSFTSRPFYGNPAAVCYLEREMNDHWMKCVAKEMNLSETAFLCKEKDGFRLRWFTPEVEVDLCGHATLASAHILWEKGYLALDQAAIFYTKSGVLTANKTSSWIEMNFPTMSTEKTQFPAELIESLNIDPVYVGKTTGGDYLLEVQSEKELRTISPDFMKLKKVEARGIIVTSVSNEADIDFVSRFFAPAIGVNEDPVTGSAHCALAPYWQHRLNKEEFIAYQASERGGMLTLRLSQDNRIYIGGQAVTVLEGKFIS